LLRNEVNVKINVFRYIHVKMKITQAECFLFLKLLFDQHLIKYLKDEAKTSNQKISWELMVECKINFG